MKKSELKALLKIITEEVVAAKNEAAGENDAKAQELLKQYNDLLKQHDWYYQYSDDPSEFRKGEASYSKINGIRRMLNDMGYAEQAANVYKERTAFLGANRAGGVQEAVSESKGLSGFKKAKESSEHTEKVADSKDLTGKGPTEKTEPVKLKYKKPANPQKVGSLKEEIMEMIRESIEEMARVKGAVGSKFKVQDPNSPTGWVVKGHKSIPDGTPTEAPKGPYIPKGDNPNMGRPKKEPVIGGKQGDDVETKDAIENILIATPEASDEEIMDQLNARVEAEENLNTNPSFVKATADEIRKERGAETAGDEDISPEEIGKMEKDAQQKKMSKLRAYLMRKKGLK